MLTLVVTGGRKMLRIFLKVLERQNMQNQTIFELYIDDNKSKYYGNPKGIFKSAKKKLWKSLHQVNFHSCYYWISKQNS